MAVLCLICENAITPTTPSTKCGTCKKHAHIKCLKLSESEIAEIINDKSSWICPKCSPSSNIISIEKIEEIIIKQLSVVQQDIKQTIENHFKAINDRLTTVEDNVRLIQEEWAAFKTSNTMPNNNSSDLSVIVAEIEERKRRSSNVLLFNLPESSSTSIAQMVADDLQQVMSILSPLGFFSHPQKVIRIGPPKSNTVRPLRIVCENENMAKDILRSNKNNPNVINSFVLI
ncbi:hypothetical protein Zmor_011541 [Zophobas morio]|uniref:PHD-type domain-containing protein n=1 Tax=Zophobas morio TaxID=2755281 RepID=A0AA38IKV1_9CUCU|nr:hypothetical protein Zmor_011541 [Zophobas morio]